MRFILLFLCFILITTCGKLKISAENISISNASKITSKVLETIPKANFEKTKTIAQQAKTFCKKNNYNLDFCLLIDLSIHSGLNRFYIWKFKSDTLYKSILVSHGCGSNYWTSDDSKDNPTFSNDDGSHCSSLGKYKIGARGNSNWGINVNYLMYGLDKTNSNALKRQIVFHSWEAVPENEVFPRGTPEGWGCPAISNSNMVLIDSMLKSSKKPVLMWIYN